MTSGPRTRPRRLGAGADLWLLAEAAVPELGAAATLERFLSAEETARYRRLRLEPVRRRFLGGRLLCRHALSAYTDVRPAEWRFAYGPFGRPELVSNPWGLRFNLSHTDGLIACVVTRGVPCGVDVELTPARPEDVALADEHFAPSERADLAGLEAGARARRFVDYWVLKESYTKALGAGLSRRLSSFAFDLGRSEITVRDTERRTAERRQWRFDLLRIGSRHACAVAVRRDEGDRRPLHVHPIRLGAVDR